MNSTASNRQVSNDFVAVFDGDRWHLEKADPLCLQHVRGAKIEWKPKHCDGLKYKTLAFSSYNSYNQLSKKQKQLAAYILEYLNTLDNPIDLHILVKVLGKYFQEAKVGFDNSISAGMFIRNMDSQIELTGITNHYFVSLRR